MPWKVQAHPQCPATRPHGVVRQTDGRLEGCHPTEDAAAAHMRALYANEPAAAAKASTVKIAKIDEDRRLVFGWASIAADDHGRLVVDSDGEVIEPGELEDAAYEYALKARAAGEQHEGEPVGRMVESFVLTPEKAAAMGLGMLPATGWWVGVRVDDEQAFGKVKDGTYQAFSIQGTAEREDVEGYELVGTSTDGTSATVQWRSE